MRMIINNMRILFYVLAFLLPTTLMAQTTRLERLFIERANILRDSVLSRPLINLEEYRMVSKNHVSYIDRTGDVSHDQRGTRLATMEDRCERFAGDQLSCGSEILTYNTHRLENDTAIVDKLLESFMSSKTHRYLLLENSNGLCTVAIHHSFNKNICVVNFYWAYDERYTHYNYSYLDASDEESALSRTCVERFEAFYNRYYD